MARLGFRQGIVKHQDDILGTPGFLDVVGGYVSLIVSPEPTIVAFVHGDANYLFTEKETITDAWGPFSPGVTNWLYWDLNRTTGVRTFGSTNLQPILSPATPTSPVTGQMWFNTINNTWFEYTGASWSEVIRVFACRLDPVLTPRSMSINAPDFRGTQVGLTTKTEVGSLVFDGGGTPIVRQDGKFFTTEDIFTTGVPSAASLRINNLVLRGQAIQPIGDYRVVEYTDYDQIAQASPLNQGFKLLGIVETGVPAGEPATMVMEGLIFNADWDWVANGSPINTPVYINATGEIVVTPIQAEQLPVGIVTAPQEIYFSPRIFPQVTVTGGGGGGGVTNHNLLTNIGINTHDQIDAHIADTAIHTPFLTEDAQGNIFGGTLSLNSVTVAAEENLSIGVDAGAALTNGSDNVLLGNNAGAQLYGSISNNVAVGTNALSGNVGGTITGGNTAIGASALSRMSGDGTVPGSGAMNTAVGWNAGAGITSGVGNVALGFTAMGNATSVITGNQNVAVGDEAMGGSTITSASENVAVGHNALHDLTTGEDNVAVGKDAGKSITEGARNILIGKDAGEDLTESTDNIAIGDDAMRNLTNGERNIIMGTDAGESLSEASKNIMFGAEAGNNLTEGEDNIFIGDAAALGLELGQSNIIMGTEAGVSLSTGTLAGGEGGEGGEGGGTLESNGNIIIGQGALGNAFVSTGTLVIGRESAGGLESTTQSVVIGNNAAQNVLPDMDDSIIIGPGAGPATQQSLENELYIHNGESDTPLIHGDFNTTTLTINGDLVVTGSFPGGVPNGGTAGQILVKQSSTDGDAIWQDPTALSAPSSEFCPGYTFVFDTANTFTIAGIDAVNILNVGRRLKFVDGASTYFGRVVMVDFDTTVPGDTYVVMLMEGGDNLTNTITEFCLVNGTAGWSALPGIPFSTDILSVSAGAIGGDDYIVIGTQSGEVAYSTDSGATWTVGTTNSSAAIQKIGYASGNQDFVLVTSTNEFAVSDDGISFTEDASGTSVGGNSVKKGFDVDTTTIYTGSASGATNFSKNTNSSPPASWSSAASSDLFGNESYYKSKNDAVLGFFQVAGNELEVRYVPSIGLGDTTITLTSGSAVPNGTEIGYPYQVQGGSLILPLGGNRMFRATNANGFSGGALVADPSFGTTNINSVAYSPVFGRWVAVGDFGKIAFSDDDGVTWAQTQNGFGVTNINYVVWDENNNVFIAVGDNGTVAISTNGIS